MQVISKGLGKVRRIGRQAVPYLLIELLLPGGTLLALLFALYQRWGPDIIGIGVRAAAGLQRFISFGSGS